jgi:hypothetical protein
MRVLLPTETSSCTQRHTPVITDDETSGILAPHASTEQVGGEWDIQQGNGFFECV